jgi:hypothetical protein
MLHKFKIGQIVNYHPPKDRMLSTARGIAADIGCVGFIS